MNIEKRRIGNDVSIRWKLTTNGECSSLNDRDLIVTCQDVFHNAVPIEWTVSGCDIIATIRGKDQRNTGIHILTLIENNGKNDQHVVDVRAVELVDHTWKLDHCHGGEILLTAEIQTSLSVAEIENFRRIAAEVPEALAAATAANEAAAEQLHNGLQRYNTDWYNMNCCLEPGVYEGCWRGRPEGSKDGEFYSCYVTIAKSALQNDGVDVVAQVAISSLDGQRVFTRKVLTRNRSVYEPPTTVYENWKILGADNMSALAEAIATVGESIMEERARAEAAEEAENNRATTAEALLAKDVCDLQMYADRNDPHFVHFIDRYWNEVTHLEAYRRMKNGANVRICQGEDIYDSGCLSESGTKEYYHLTTSENDAFIPSNATELPMRLRISLSCCDGDLAVLNSLILHVDDDTRNFYYEEGFSLNFSNTFANKDEVDRQAGFIAKLQAAIDTLVGTQNATAAIDSFREVVAFLEGIDGTTLDSLLTTIRNSVATERERAMGAEAAKQDIIEDLAAIRRGAAAGATAYQKPVTGIPKSDMAAAVQESLNKANTALQQHQDLSHLATKAEQTSLQENVAVLTQRVTDLEFEQGDYYVEAYEPNTTDVTPVKTYGNKALLKQFDFILLDTTDNTGSVTHKTGVLKRNNLLRYADGAWAPVVGITAEQAADAQLELYALAGGEYVQYCEAGAYDAGAYVEEVLRPWYAGTLEAYDGPQLYKSDGEGGYVEAHALCPWETTETKYTIGIGAQHRLYVLDNVIGESGKVWKGLFMDKTEWDGIDLTHYALEPTAISPCPVCTILEDGVHKTRSFFYLHSGDTNCNGATGINGTFNMFAPGGRTYPRTLDVGQTHNMSWARANNADAESPLPFAEGGYFALDAFVIAQELLYSRRNPFRASQFGSGISSNDACNSETTWRTNGGVRYRRSDADSPSYAPFSSNAAVYYMSDGTAKRTDWSNTLNRYAPKEQCMESQIVASFATEFGLPATTDVTAPLYFEVYGGQYYYMTVQDAQGLEDGYMNVRIYRELEQTGTAWRDAEGNPVEYDIAVVLRMSLFAGANISGDIYAYWGGGCEVVGTCGENTGNNTAGHVMDGYLQPDQSKWMHETTTSLPNHGRFAFEAEDAYPHLGTWLNKANGYAIQRNAYLPSRSKAGGSMSQGECYYSYEGKHWSSTVGTRARVGLRFRGSASLATCSPRYWYALFGASFAFRYFGGSAQARFE